MKHQNNIHRAVFLLTLLSLCITFEPTAGAENPANICRRLPAMPAPQTASTLRVFAAYLTPTIIAQFGTSANQTDNIYQSVVHDRSRTLRDFSRSAQPYQWEIGLFWNFSRLHEERTITPLTEAFQHHEYQLREAYRICRDLRRYTFQNSPDTRASNIDHDISVDRILANLNEQRIAALLQIYAPKVLISMPQSSHHAVVTTGSIP